MKENKKHGFLSGAFILVFATAAVKIIGAIFKIPLTALLGGDGMGYYSTAYSLFNPISAAAITGLPVAVAKVVAANRALGNYKNIKKIFRITVIAFLTVGIIGTGAILLFAKSFVNYVNNPMAYLSVVAIAPAMLFCCLMSIYRGYYEGLRNMIPAATSQIVEAVVKLIFGYGFSAAALRYGLNCYESGLPVYGVNAISLAEAKSASLPYASAAAVVGVSVSTFFGFVYLFIKHRRLKGGITADEILNSGIADSGKALFLSLVAVAVPVSLGSLVTNLTTLIDVSSLMQRIGVAVETNPDAVYGMYQNVISDTAVISGNLPNYLYGIYSAMAITVYNLVPAITAGIGISALPMITESFAAGNKDTTRKNIETVIRVVSMIALPAGIGLAVLSGPILHTLFYTRSMEADIATPMLAILGIAVIFTSMTLPVYNMLQGIGKAGLTVVIMIIGGAIKLTVNYFLTSIPEINIMGAPIGTLVCYLFIFSASLSVLIKASGTKPRIAKSLFKTLICSAGCGAVAILVYKILEMITDGGRLILALKLGLSVLSGVVIYVILLFITKNIEKIDILMLPNGKNIVKTLEKLKIIW